MSRKRHNTGQAAAYELVLRHPLARAGAIAALRELLITATKRDPIAGNVVSDPGNLTHVGRDQLGLSGAQPLSPLIDDLCLRQWLQDLREGRLDIERELSSARAAVSSALLLESEALQRDAARPRKDVAKPAPKRREKPPSAAQLKTALARKGAEW